MPLHPGFARAYSDSFDESTTMGVECIKLATQIGIKADSAERLDCFREKTA